MKANYSNENDNENYDCYDSENEESIDEKQNKDNKREKLIQKLNTVLRKYLKENEQINIFVSMLILFRRKKYQNIEYYEMYNYLTNSFKKNENKFILKNKSALKDKKRKQTLNNLFDEIDDELKKNKALDMVIKGEEKMIELNLSKAIEKLTTNNNDKGNNKDIDLTEEKNKENKNTYLKKKVRRNSLPRNENILKKRKIKDKNIPDNKNMTQDKISDLTLEKENRNKKRSKSQIANLKSENNKNKNKGIKGNEIKEEKAYSKESEKPIKRKGRPKKINLNNEKEKMKEKVKEKETKVSKISEIKLDSEEVNNLNNNNKLQERNITYEEIPKMNEEFLTKISKAKSDLESFELKMKNVNEKILGLENNKKEYNSMKKLLDESQAQLNSIYTIMENWFTSLKIFQKMENYDKKLYYSHKYTIFSYKKYYLEISNKIKDYINKLYLIESDIKNNEKDIKESYKGISSLQKEILGNMNFNFENIINIIDKGEKCEKVDDIVNNLIKQGDILIEEIEQFEKSQNNNNEISEENIEEEKNNEKEESIEAKDLTESKEMLSENKESIEEIQ
jgi:hypothetical protein